MELVEPGAVDYAGLLLKQLGIAATVEADKQEHPALANARCGLVRLNGQICPAPLAGCADGVLLALTTLAPSTSALSAIQGSQLLTERAALMGLVGQGRIAAGGSCRLLDAADGRIAVNLARGDDWAMLPAWLETEELDGVAQQWETLANLLADRSSAALVERGRPMGLAVAQECLPQRTDHWYEVIATGSKKSSTKPPIVLDLSSLWAGPLCGHLLIKMGARVIKVESSTRPDGARNGNADFYDLLNEDKQSLSLDLKSDKGRAQLKKLISQADIVIESARPRALRQMGIVAEDMLANQPGLTWVSITAYGRAGDEADWIGFGDDAAVAAGLSGLMATASGESSFVGDAVADPLTGMHAALAAWAHYQQGGGVLLSLSLKQVAEHCSTYDLPDKISDIQARFRGWSNMVSPDEVQPPQPRYASASARSLGADNAALIAEFDL